MEDPPYAYLERSFMSKQVKGHGAVVSSRKTGTISL